MQEGNGAREARMRKPMIVRPNGKILEHFDTSRSAWYSIAECQTEGITLVLAGYLQKMKAKYLFDLDDAIKNTRRNVW